VQLSFRMSADILKDNCTEVNSKNIKIETCINKNVFDSCNSLSINDLLENIRILLKYILSRKTKKVKLKIINKIMNTKYKETKGTGFKPVPAISELMKNSWKIEKLNNWEKDRYYSWLSFYRIEFQSLCEFRKFASECYNIKKNGNKANLILNHGQRLMELADNSGKMIKNRASFQIFFLIVCSESVIRIIENKSYEKCISEKSVAKFFESYFLDKDKKLFESYFKRSLADEKFGTSQFNFDFKDIIKYFYKIRCKIAHQGMYWGFSWANEDADMMNFIEDEDRKGKVVSDIIEVKRGVDYKKIRPLFIRAIINATKSIL